MSACNSGERSELVQSHCKEPHFALWKVVPEESQCQCSSIFRFDFFPSVRL